MGKQDIDYKARVGTLEKGIEIIGKFNEELQDNIKSLKLELLKKNRVIDELTSQVASLKKQLGER